VRIAAALLIAGSAAAAAAAAAVRAADADQTIAGRGAGPLVLLVAVAVALSAAGAVTWNRRPDSAVGALLLCGAVAWCAAQLASPAAPSAVLFTAGLAFGTAAPAVIALAILPERRGGALLAVAAVGLLGVISALLFDPRATGCTECPGNLLLVRGDAGLYDTLQRAGLWLGAAAIGWLLGSAGVWLLRSGAAARARHGPAILAAAVYLGAVAAQYVHGIPRGYLSADGIDRSLWTLQGAALLLAAAWLGSEPLRERRARARLARLVVDLETRPGPRGLRDVLAGVLRDPGLRLAYPLPDGRRLDAAGRPVSLDVGQEVTELRDRDLTLAEIMHAPGLLDDPTAVSAIASDTRLTLRNERLHAELRARLEDLREMRGRIVAAGDAERRRLERDLHDGAQQRLATLAVSLEVARARATGDHGATLARACAGVRATLAATRDVAHGLIPAVLADEGLAPAIEAFAETADAEVWVPDPLPPDRLEPAVEATAYHVVCETVRRAGQTEATIRAVRDDGRLVVSINIADPPAGDLVDLDDRVGALGGKLRVERSDGASQIVAEFPCA
jgi:signal transduction histidine kinase